MKKILLLLAVLFSELLVAQSFQTRNVATGFDTPWEMLWGPDNFIWLTERPGKINRVNPETGVVQNLITIQEVVEGSERGLMGLAILPSLTGMHKVYTAYTYGPSNATLVKVVSYDFNIDKLINPVVIIDNITGNSTHDGCRLFIDGDKLFITTGDAQQLDRPQNTSSTNGKILRLNLDGSIPADNPIAGNPMWSFGHRNPQGMVIVNGKIYSSEHGPNNDDEVNLIEKGRNYGWPDVEGLCNENAEQTFCQQNNVVEPLKVWTPTLAVAGIDYYNKSLFPELSNSLLMVSLKAGRLTLLKLNAQGTSVTEEKTLVNNTYGRLRDLCISPDGRIFIATSNRDGRGTPRTGDDKIIELKPSTSSITQLGLSALQLSPNPVRSGELLNIGFPFTGNFTLSLIDITGKLLVNQKVESKAETSFDLSSVKAGIYFLKVQNGQTELVKRVVVY